MVWSHCDIYEIKRLGSFKRLNIKTQEDHSSHRIIAALCFLNPNLNSPKLAGKERASERVHNCQSKTQGDPQFSTTPPLPLFQVLALLLPSRWWEIYFSLTPRELKVCLLPPSSRQVARVRQSFVRDQQLQEYQSTTDQQLQWDFVRILGDEGRLLVVLRLFGKNLIFEIFH